MKFQNEKTDFPNLKLMLWEKTMLPESNQQLINGKKEFVKTGNMTEMTTYTFRDASGEKLVFLSSNNTYRALEGKVVEVYVNVEYNEFTRKNQLRLLEVVQAKDQAQK